MNHNHVIEVPMKKGNCQLLINQITFPSDRAGSEHSWLWIDFESIKWQNSRDIPSLLKWLLQRWPLVSNYLHCLAWCHSTPPSWLPKPTSLLTEDKMKIEERVCWSSDLRGLEPFTLIPQPLLPPSSTLLCILTRMLPARLGEEELRLVLPVAQI